MSISALTRPAALLAFLLIAASLHAQNAPDIHAIVHSIDAAVAARIDHVRQYSVTEHYTVIRNHDTAHPSAEMIVNTLSRAHEGKSYTIASQSGSSLYLNQLKKVLDNEHEASLPGHRERVLINSDNYTFALTSNQPEHLGDRLCWRLTLQPRRNEESLFAGTLWVDANDGGIVQLDATAVKAGHIGTSPAHVLRRYAPLHNFAMATDAEATTTVMLLGQIQIHIDYRNYQLELR